MSKRNFEQTLAAPIRNALIEKFLLHENHQVITEWLLEQHGIKAARSVIYRRAKANRDKYERLVQLGMPIKMILENRLQIEAFGVAQVEQTLIEKLKEKSGSLFSYLDETEGGR